MTTGFLLGIGAAFLWSIVNLIDKYLVERFSKDTGIGALILLSSLFPVTLLPLSYFLEAGNIILPLQSIILLMFSGVLTTLWITLYLYALEDDDASTVMPIFQLTPIITLGTAFFFLGEMPPPNELIAGGIILLGSLILGYEFATGKMKWKLLALIGGASACIALMNTLFKLVAQDASFWTSIFWHVVGIVCTSILLFALHATYRAQFISFIKQNAGIGLSLNGINETLTVAGDVIFASAILLAPLALVQTTEAFQPIFVFFIAAFFAFTTPTLLNEDFSKRALIQKLVGIIIVIVGSLVLYLY